MYCLSRLERLFVVGKGLVTKLKITAILFGKVLRQNADDSAFKQSSYDGRKKENDLHRLQNMNNLRS